MLILSARKSRTSCIFMKALKSEVRACNVDHFSKLICLHALRHRGKFRPLSVDISPSGR
jgi:hypothetical protein